MPYLQLQFLGPSLAQVATLGFVAPIVLFILGAPALEGFLYGAACAALPQAYFALRMAQAARHSAARAARLGLAAEGGKFLLSAVFFALVFAVLKPTQPGMVFLGYGVSWLAQTVAVICFLRAQ